MRNLILTTVLAAAGTGALIYLEQSRDGSADIDVQPTSASTEFVQRSIHAPGRVEGRTESLFIRPEFSGTVAQVLVSRGQTVAKGTPLFRLDDIRFRARLERARAALDSARAAKMKLVDGARDSEIETVRQELTAANARLTESQKRFERAKRLITSQAISQQELDAIYGEVESNHATMLAHRQRLTTVSAPPRESELLAADASIASAEAEIKLIQVDLQKCTVVAPINCVVLDIEIHPGEWINPALDEPAIELVDAEQLRIVADIDERDSLLVRLGQECVVTTDAISGETYIGTVEEIEPRMEPKRIFGGWADERNDTHTRRIWLDLRTSQRLPIGLPVEVTIDVQ